MVRRITIVCLSLPLLCTAAVGKTVDSPNAVQPSPYVVDGLALGGRVQFQSQIYRQYHCNPSEQFAALTWCQRQETKLDGREQITQSNLILHTLDGTAVYISRYIEPAFFGPNEVRSEIDRLSAKYSEHARELWLQQNDRLPSAVIAYWGRIQLERLDTNDVTALASGRSPHRGMLISFLGDLERSAKVGVPVYRITGGDGFVWAATLNNNGRGVLRFLAIDASKLTPTAQPQFDDLTEADKQFEQQWQAHNYAQAEPLAQKVLALCQGRFGQNNIQCAWAIYNLALVYHSENKFAEAEPLYRRALAVREQALGADHPDVATTAVNLANVYLGQGQYAQAQPFYERALAVFQTVKPADDPYVATTIENLAAVYASQNEFRRVEALYQRILAWRESALGRNHPAVATTFDRLKSTYYFDEGLTYKIANNYTDAESVYQRALAFFEKEEGVGSADAAEAAGKLADAFEEEKKYSEAEAVCRLFMEDRERAFGPDDISVASAAEKLAAIYKSEKKYVDASGLYRRALTIREKRSGLNDPAVATALSALGAIAAEQSDYGAAEELYKRALAIRQKAVDAGSEGVSHLDVANTFGELAGIYHSESKFDQEEHAREQEIAATEDGITAKEQIAKNSTLASALDKLAWMYEGRGQYSKELASLERILAIEEQEYGSTMWVGAWTFGDPFQHSADLYERLGRYHDAYQVRLRKLELLQREAARREQKLHDDQQKNKETEARYVRNEVADAIERVGTVLTELARYTEALAYYQRAQSLLEAGADNAAMQCAVLVKEIGLYDRLGQPRGVESAIEKLMSLYDRDSLSAEHDMFLGSVCIDADPVRILNEHRQYRQAAQIIAFDLRRDGEPVSLLIELADVYDRWGQYQKAEEAYEQALAEAKLVGTGPWVDGNINSIEGRALLQLMVFYQSHDRHDEADKILEKLQAVDRQVMLKMPNNENYLLFRGLIYQRMGRVDEAETSFARALPLLRKQGNPNIASTLDQIAAGYQKLGAIDLALNYSRRATEIISSSELLPSERPISLRFFGALQQNEAYHQDYFGHHLKSIADAVRRQPKLSKALGREALEVSQRAYNSSAATALQQMVSRFGAGGGALATLVRESQDLVAFELDEDKKLADELAKPLSNQESTAINALRKQIAIIETKLAADAQRLESDFPDYAAIVRPKPLKLGDVQALLGDDEALVFCLAGDRQSYVFAVTRDAFDWKVIPLGGNELAAKVAAFREGLNLEEINKAIEKGKSPKLFDLGLANALFATLLGPVESLINDKKQLLIVPSGALTALPFNLLVTEQPAIAMPEKMSGYRDAAWLIKRQAVTVLPSVASLKALRVFAKKDEANKSLIGFGDPVFSPNVTPAGGQRIASNARARDLTTRSYTDFWQGAEIDRTKLAQDLKPLPDTAVELKAVAKDLGVPASDLHLGRDASETKVKNLPLADYRIVYFATHALVAGDVKGLGEPALALSIPAQPTDLDDGLLTASEVAQLKLNADWVVLSACNTVAGDKPSAEALSGLARAFFYAGARALLVSHWAVATDAATRLTTSTFDILKANPTIGRAEALRRAELACLNDPSDPRNAYPAFWAPFEIVGEGGAR